MLDKTKMLNKNIEEAIDDAVKDIQTKSYKTETKKMFPWKKLFRAKYNLIPASEYSSKDVNIDLQQGKYSTIITTSKVDRKFLRREAVAERNTTERQLVKKVLKNYIRTQHVAEYNFDKM